MDVQEKFVCEHKELLNLILSTVRKLRDEGDYNSLTLLSAALAGVASALMDEIKEILAEINRQVKQ